MINGSIKTKSICNLFSWIITCTFFCTKRNHQQPEIQITAQAQPQIQEIIDPYQSDLKDQDLIRTFDNGKVRLILMGGDMMFLARKTGIRFEDITLTRFDFSIYSYLQLWN